MKEYDVVIVGSGCGMLILNMAIDAGKTVALIDKGPLGGTCLNLGCVPSKILIYPADLVTQIQEAGKLGIEAQIQSINFGRIMERMQTTVRTDAERIRQELIELTETGTFGLYESEGRFVEDLTLQVDGDTVKGRQVFIAAGSRPLIPPINGLDSVNYLTSESVLGLKSCPESLIIIGGGFVAVEYAHFFAAMGARVSMVEMTDRLLQGEEPEISHLVKLKMGRRMQVLLNTTATQVKSTAAGCSVTVRDNDTGETRDLAAERVMIAAGRRSNADRLDPARTGVATNARGFIQVDEYLETARKGIYAIGDINGSQMFTHVANREALTAWHNSQEKERIKFDYSAAPHAVFCHPQVASVGLTEAEAKKSYHIKVGRARYTDTAKGIAMVEEAGFAKAIVDAHEERLLGFHIAGPNAAELIQEAVNAMAIGNMESIHRGMHIHPALSELVPQTLNNLEEPIVSRETRLRRARSKGSKLRG